MENLCTKQLMKELRELRMSLCGDLLKVRHGITGNIPLEYLVTTLPVLLLLTNPITVLYQYIRITLIIPPSLTQSFQPTLSLCFTIASSVSSLDYPH